MRNSLRSRKAVANKVASVLGILLALVFSVVLALGLGIVAYFLSRPNALAEVMRRSATPEASTATSVEFIFFSIYGIVYLMWATVPLSIGGSKQFDASKMLIYPITLRKLFAVDYVSELTTLHSVFAVPALLALSIGAGLGSGNLAASWLVAVPAILFGVSLSKWLSTIIASLVRRKRARGETLLALIGAVAGLGAAAAGQLAPVLFKHAESLPWLRWTPPGAAAFMLSGSEGDTLAYAISFLTLSAYAVLLIVSTYRIARRAALGLEGRRRPRDPAAQSATLEGYTGWRLPFVSPDLSALIEKEIRYAMRNAQVRMMALMPLLLILLRVLNSRDIRTMGRGGPNDFLTYAAVMFAAGGVFYVFVILVGMSANAFAFEEGGMRTLILAPVDRRKILLAKNIAVTVVAFIFSTVLLILNAIIFRDLTLPSLLFVLLSFFIFAALSSMVGNWLSIYFPKRQDFGKRMNVSGVAGLLFIPLIVVLAVPPFVATLVGFFTRSMLNQYLTLLVLTLLSIGLYLVVLNFQGRVLARREIDILESVREPVDE
ncbi:MAG TPA: ABC transporter permease [Pyrinomonadaceae bacterium]|nr:ABC transporter permease [Pyrinomonadaceae bacterium]